MKVLLIDDHPLILAALQAVIAGLGDDVTVLGVSTERDARAALKHDPDQDLVLLDLHLGDADGFALLAELRGLYPALPIVVVSASDRASDVIRAIDAGAMGFVPKRASNDTLFDALRLVMSGGIYVPPMILGLGPSSLPAPAAESQTGFGSGSSEGDTVPDVMRPQPIDVATGDPGHAADLPWRPHGSVPASIDALGLSKRQTEVLAYLLQGMPNKIIARELHLSIETVKDHVAGLLRALHVSTRTQAVLAVSQMTQQAAAATPGRKRKPP